MSNILDPQLLNIYTKRTPIFELMKRVIFEGPELYYIDPNPNIDKLPKETIIIKEKATVGVETFISKHLQIEKTDD